MYEITKYNTVEQYIESTRENSQGTPFEGLADVLQKHKNILGFYFEHSDEITSDFIGSKESLFREGVEIDTEKVVEIIEETDDFRSSESYRYTIDLNEFLLDVLNNRTENWDEFVSVLLEVRDVLPDSRETAIEIFNELQEESRDNLIAQAEAMCQFYDEIGAGSAVIRYEREIEMLEMMTKEEIYITSKEREIEEARDMLKIIEWREENKADIGDYVVYEAHVENNRSLSDLDVEITPNTVYRAILKITGKRNKIVGEEPVTHYDFQTVAFDNEILKVWPNHFVINGDKPLAPQEQDNITVYKENPIGSVEMKVLDYPNADENYAFRPD